MESTFRRHELVRFLQKKKHQILYIIFGRNPSGLRILSTREITRGGTRELIITRQEGIVAIPMVIRETFSGEFMPSLKTRFHDVLLVKHAQANTLNGTENMTFEKRATPATFPLPLSPSGAKKESF